MGPIVALSSAGPLMHVCGFRAQRLPRRMPLGAVSARAAQLRNAAVAADPEQRPRLGNNERREQRRKAAELHQAKLLKPVQIGKAGVSRNTYVMVGDALEKYGLCKVKMGGGCTMELPEVIHMVEEACGCVCVQSVGFTAIFYRKLGLERPAATLPAAAGEVEASESEGEFEEGDFAGPRHNRRREGPKKKRRAAKPGGGGRQDKPDQFTVL
ncbi:unnamed protein product [Pedinophyceae sp. YPF-701]|nr:unnamed protein product [Pedinophyceae sp. YPF-701]